MPARLWASYVMDPEDALLTAYHGLHQAIVLREAAYLCLPAVQATELTGVSDYYVEGTPGQVAKLLFHLERLGITGFTVDVDKRDELEYFNTHVSVPGLRLQPLLRIRDRKKKPAEGNGEASAQEAAPSTEVEVKEEKGVSG